MRTWRKRGIAWMLSLTLGGGLLALTGCDPTVRDTVLKGVGDAATSLATTFIQAFFDSLNKPAQTNTPTTVQAQPGTMEIFT